MEISIEEKAKAYDEAKYIMKRYLKSGNAGVIAENTIKKAFPELAESEDERIRKAIINVFAIHKDYEVFFGASVEEILAWLEKQSKETSWKPSKEEMDVLYGLAYITDQYDEYKEEIITRLYQDLKREFFNGSSYENMFPNTEDSVRRRSTIQVLEYARSLDTYNQYGKVDIDKNIAWLEKQGKNNMGISEATKQKLEDNLNKALEQETPESWNKFLDEQGEQKMKTPEESLGVDSDTYNKIVDECVYGEQKPADNGEPKFKVEEEKWYVCTQTYVLRGKIVVIKGQTYQAEKDNVIKGEDGCLFIDRHDGKASEYFRYWTIQDAKDGDVLCYKDEISLYRHDIKNCTKQETTFGGFVYYCCYDGKRFVVNSLYSLTEQDKMDIHPATKEQHETLFKAMADAGWEFNFEKKELKKIEQKPAWSEEDEFCINQLIIFCENCMVQDSNAKKCADWLKSIKDRVQPKQEWSEEDGKMLSDIIKDLVHPWNEYIPDRIEDEIKWLKNRLKSLRPQSQWKPSEEQMKAIEFMVRSFGESGTLSPYGETMAYATSLLNDLKKLKA